MCKSLKALFVTWLKVFSKSFSAARRLLEASGGHCNRVRKYLTQAENVPPLIKIVKYHRFVLKVSRTPLIKCCQAHMRVLCGIMVSQGFLLLLYFKTVTGENAQVRYFRMILFG